MKSYFETIVERLIASVTRTNLQAEQKDVSRNHVNYGCSSTLATIIRDLGHMVDLPMWGNNGCLRIPYIEIDGKTVAEFERR